MGINTDARTILEGSLIVDRCMVITSGASIRACRRPYGRESVRDGGRCQGVLALHVEAMVGRRRAFPSRSEIACSRVLAFSRSRSGGVFSYWSNRK